MILTGIGDEGANTIDGQIKATKDLGWKYLEPRGVEVPGFAKANFHEIPNEAFDVAVRKLETAGIGVYCFGSTIMNWSKKVDDPFEITLAEVKRAIPRMKRVGAKYVRIMSFKPGDEEYKIPNEVFRRVKDVTNMFRDAGLSIEPHMVVVFHEANSKASDEAMQKNYVEYGRRLESIIEETNRELKRAAAAPATVTAV